MDARDLGAPGQGLTVDRLIKPAPPLQQEANFAP
jgi:hypothetical protein